MAHRRSVYTENVTLTTFSP